MECFIFLWAGVQAQVKTTSKQSKNIQRLTRFGLANDKTELAAGSRSHHPHSFDYF